jgi:hypothetical protein
VDIKEQKEGRTAQMSKEPQKSKSITTKAADQKEIMVISGRPGEMKAFPRSGYVRKEKHGKGNESRIPALNCSKLRHKVQSEKKKQTGNGSASK